MQKYGVPAGIGVIGGLWTGFAFAQGGMGLVVLTAAVGVVLALLHRPEWGLWILVLAHPVLYAFPGVISRTGDFLLPLLILGALGLHRLMDRREILLPPGKLGLWFAVFTGWIAFTSLFGAAPASGLMTAFRYALLAATVIAVWNLWTPVRMGQALFCYSLVLVPVAAIGLWQAAVWGATLARFDPLAPNRIFSIYNNPNTLGYVMGHGLVILVAYTLVYWTRKKVSLERGVLLGLLLGAILLLFLGLAVSVSRSSFLYAGTAIALLTLSRKELRLPALATVLGIAGLVAIRFPDLFLYAMRPGSGFSFRDSLWRAGWGMLQDHPWTGVGIGGGTFEELRAAYVTTSAHRGLLTTGSGEAHNVFLTKGAEMGWVGLILAVILFAVLLSRIPGAVRDYQEGNWLRGAAAAGILGLTLRGFFESGVTLGTGHVTHSLIFFLFALVLLRKGDPAPAPPLAPS